MVQPTQGLIGGVNDHLDQVDLVSSSCVDIGGLHGIPRCQGDTRGMEQVLEDAFSPVKKKRRRNNHNGVDDIVCTVKLDDDSVGDTPDTPATTLVSIEGMVFTAVVDTGACASVISIKHINRLRLKDSIEKADRKLLDANGKQIPLLGTISLPVMFGKTIRHWVFWVANNARVPMILGNNILKNANIMGQQKVIQIDGDVQPISFNKLLDVAYIITTTQGVYVPPQSSCWIMGIVHLGDNTEYKGMPCIEYVGMEIDEQCNTLDAVAVMLHAKETHKDCVSHSGYVPMEVLNESILGIHLKKGKAIGRLLGKRDSLNLVKEDSDCSNKEDTICTIFPHMAYTNKMDSAEWELTGLTNGNKEYNPHNSEIDHTLVVVGESGVVSAALTPFTATAVSVSDCFQIGRVEEGLESLCDVGSVRLSEKMIVAYPYDAGGTTLLETLGSRSYSDTISPNTSAGTLAGDLGDTRSEVPGCMVQSYDLLKLDGKVATSHQEQLDKHAQGNKQTSDPGNNENNPLRIGVSERELLQKLASEADGTPIQIQKLKAILDIYLDVFSNNLVTAGQAKLFPHSIKLTSELPLWTAQHRRSYVENQVIDAETKKLAEQEVVRQSKSPYNSPVMVVKKKDGAWRTVIDYRKINEVTLKEPHPIPRTDESLEALGEANFFTTLDFTSGYWQLPIREEDKQKTAYSTISGRWEYNVLPMGITNAPAAFQRSMEIVMAGITWKFCIVYIDDIIIYSKTFEEHLQHLQLVFERLRQYKLHAKPVKCKFAKHKVEYLGHVVGRGEMRPTENNIRKVSEARLPTTVKEIKQFNGIASYYRKFIPGFAKIMKPLTDLMSKKAQAEKGIVKRGKFVLGADGVEAYNTIKMLLTSSPVLVLPNFHKAFSSQN